MAPAEGFPSGSARKTAAEMAAATAKASTMSTASSAMS
jgi:hypothetical protein